MRMQRAKITNSWLENYEVTSGFPRNAVGREHCEGRHCLSVVNVNGMPNFDRPFSRL